MNGPDQAKVKPNMDTITQGDNLEIPGCHQHGITTK